MKRLLAMVAALFVGIGSVHAAPQDTVWLSLGEPAWRLLQQIEPAAEPLLTRPLQAPSPADGGGAPPTLRLVEVSSSQRDALARAVHRQLHHCGGFFAHDSLIEALAWITSPPLGFTPTRPAYHINQQALVQPMLADVSATRIAADILDLSAFHNRYYDSWYGAKAADWLVSQWHAIAAGRSDISVSEVYRTGAGDAMPSVVLKIEGRRTPAQVVVLGGHLDSINWNDRDDGVPLGLGRAPGADDDASGIAAITEALRVLVAHGYRPARSIHLMAYSGEERGLYGSKFIAADYASRQVDVVGVLQLDMTNYAGSSDDIYLISDNTDNQQNAFLEQLVATYLPVLTVADTYCGYACSDHASWDVRGYAASFPFEAAMGQDNPNIHTSHDTLANSGGDALHARKFTRLALAWLVELGGNGDVIFADGFEHWQAAR